MGSPAGPGRTVILTQGPQASTRIARRAATQRRRPRMPVRLNPATRDSNCCVSVSMRVTEQTVRIDVNP